ncbi:hypothetical protein A2U01_0073308, partial [Trifolium medium]|nr:hypothetical protein [Trifolium medium]
ELMNLIEAAGLLKTVKGLRNFYDAAGENVQLEGSDERGSI